MEKIAYRFSPNISPKKVTAIKLIDKLLYFALKGPDQSAIRSDIKEITIVQFAHIGDLILMLPALKKLKTISGYKIKLVVNSQNAFIAKKLDFIDSVVVADAPWFSRGKKSTHTTFIKQLKEIDTDLIFDVRGDLRNNLYIKLFTRFKVFAGYNVGGGEALLNKVLPFDHNGHSSDLITPLFDYLNLPDIPFSETWSEHDVPNEVVTELEFNNPFVVVHLGAGAQSRRWPVANFINLIKLLSTKIPVYVLGTSQDATAEEMGVISSIPNVTNCVGPYSLLKSIYILKQATFFVGLESGFSHIAAMLKKKSFILFSGTSNINVWKPYSFYPDQITLMNRVVPCDMVVGCGKFVCENNICMTNIKPLEVYDQMLPYLDKINNTSYNYVY